MLIPKWVVSISPVISVFLVFLSSLGLLGEGYSTISSSDYDNTCISLCSYVVLDS